MKYIDTLFNLNPLSMKWYVLIGSILGVTNSLIMSYGENILMTMVLGFCGAVGAATGKLLIDKIVKRNNENDPKNTA